MKVDQSYIYYYWAWLGMILIFVLGIYYIYKKQNQPRAKN